MLTLSMFSFLNIHFVSHVFISVSVVFLVFISFSFVLPLSSTVFPFCPCFPFFLPPVVSCVCPVFQLVALGVFPCFQCFSTFTSLCAPLPQCVSLCVHPFYCPSSCVNCFTACVFFMRVCVVPMVLAFLLPCPTCSIRCPFGSSTFFCPSLFYPSFEPPVILPFSPLYFFSSFSFSFFLHRITSSFSCLGVFPKVRSHSFSCCHLCSPPFVSHRLSSVPSHFAF